jgi:hypothetical protein
VEAAFFLEVSIILLCKLISFFFKVVIFIKKFLLLLTILLLTSSTTVHGLSWAYSFVVWKGKVYEVTKETIEMEQVGKRIGAVKTRPNEMTGNYYGDASNAYEIGTKYYKINDVATSKAIAVEVEKGHWQKAVFAHEAPFHWLDLFTKILPILMISAMILSLIYWLFKKTRSSY